MFILEKKNHKPDWSQRCHG